MDIGNGLFTAGRAKGLGWEITFFRRFVYINGGGWMSWFHVAVGPINLFMERNMKRRRS